MIINTVVKSLTKIAKNIWNLKIYHDDELFYFNAGQYVWLITDSGRRAFSVASSSTYPNTLDLVFKEFDESKFIKSVLSLKNGDRVSIDGPRGSFRVPERYSDSIFIAGGVGISPFLSIMRSLSSKKESRNITLVTVNSSVETEIFVDELKNIEKNDKNFNYIRMYGKVSPDKILEIRNKHLDANWYVVGSQRFVDMLSGCLDYAKVEPKNVFYEENFPSCKELNINFDDTSFFKKIIDQAAIHVVITDLNGNVVYANKSAERFTGYTFEEMLGNSPRLWGGILDAKAYTNLWKTIKIDQKVYKSDIVNIRKNGEKYNVIATISPIFEDLELVGFLGTEQDTTEHAKINEEYTKIQKLLINNEVNKN